MPITAITSPGMVISNIPNPGRPWAWETPSTRRLVEVPISVQVPPRMLANDSGISSFDGANPRVWETEIITGVRMTTTGVLFMNAEIRATRVVITATAISGERHFTRDRPSPISSMTPVRSSAALRTSMQAMVIGALLLKTARTSSLSRMPTRRRTATAESATMSDGSVSRMKPKKTITTRTRTTTI